MNYFSISSITELVRRQLSGGYPSDIDRIKDAEIKMHIISFGNAAIGAQVLSTTYNTDGESIPEGVVLADYVVSLVSDGFASNFSIAKLPVTPLYLPNRLGVFQVLPSNFPASPPFIQIPPSMYYSITGDKYLNPIAGNCYSWDKSDAVTIYADLAGDSVILRLCVLDFNKYGNTDNLPLTPDMVSVIVAKIVDLYKTEAHTKRTESIQPEPQ
jgi:hypothetical protein